MGTPIVVHFNNPIESNTINQSTFLLGTSIGGSQISAESIIIGSAGDLGYTSAILINAPDRSLCYEKDHLYCVQQP